MHLFGYQPWLSWLSISVPGFCLTVGGCLFAWLVLVCPCLLKCRRGHGYMCESSWAWIHECQWVPLWVHKNMWGKHKLWVRKDCVSFLVGDDVPLHWSPLFSTSAHTHTYNNFSFFLCRNGLYVKFRTMYICKALSGGFATKDLSWD